MVVRRRRTVVGASLESTKPKGPVAASRALSLRPAEEAVRWIERWHREERLDAATCGEKEALLGSSLTVFYRATPGLFHLDLRGVHRKLARLLPTPAPRGLVSGDPHLGNYGSFRGPAGTPVFGLNDFDQYATGVPLSVDLLRLATSVCLQGTELKLADHDLRHCVRAAVDGWAQGLREGVRQASYLGPDEASRPVATLLGEVAQRTQHVFAAGHCEHVKGSACFREHPQLRELRGPARAKVLSIVQTASRGFARGGPVKRPLEVLDVRWKLGSGGSSYGLPRAYVLVRGPPDKPARIIECKALLPSLTKVPNARRARADAKACLQAQKALGGNPSQLAGFGRGAERGYLVRELERFKGKLNLAALELEPLEEVAREAGVLLAHSHTRQPAQAKAIRAWTHGNHVALEESVFAFVLSYRAQARADLAAFRKACAAKKKASRSPTTRALAGSGSSRP